MSPRKIPCCECHELRKIYSHGSCRRCHTKRINRRALEKIVCGFKPKSEYNGEIFELFINDFNNRHIKNSDIPVAKRFATYLEVNSVAKILSWQDIFDLSSSANIKYTNHAVHGCPFKRVGRAMQRQGLIVNIRFSRTGQLVSLMSSFPEEIRPMMNEFYQEVAKAHRRTSSALKILVSVNVFSKFIGKPVLEAKSEDAQKFIVDLGKYSSAHFTERVRSVKRFFAWAKVKGLCDGNPFENKKFDHLHRLCPDCGKKKYFWTSDNFCDECYRNNLFTKLDKALVSAASIKWEYNQHLLGLYSKYITRYKIKGRHVQVTKLLIKFLMASELKPLKSWLDVGKARRAFMQYHGLTKVPTSGCPIEKIAYVLQELGVLPIREEDHTIYIESAIKSADKKIAAIISEYLQSQRHLGRSNRSLHATFSMIHKFHLWVVENGCHDIFAAPETLARQYILAVPTQDKAGILRKVLNRFYRWAIYKKKTIYNPFAAIEAIVPQSSIEICPNEITKKLERFIKSSTSDQESALLLCLILYFGFTATNLATATVDMSCKQLCITLHRGELSYAHKVHKRDQVLKLPTEPDWILRLQNRYKSFWQERFKKIKKDIPSSPLFLRSDSRHGRSLRTLAIRDRVKIATSAAVGFEIPVSVIRRTGAHVYSQQIDAAVLPEFGWSRDYSYDFVWRQRRFFTPKSK